MDTASNGALDSEFGTHKEEEVVAKILETGSIVESEVRFTRRLRSRQRPDADIFPTGARPQRRQEHHRRPICWTLDLSRWRNGTSRALWLFSDAASQQVDDLPLQSNEKRYGVPSSIHR